MLAIVMAPFVMPLPLLPHLAAQLYTLSVVGGNGSLCAAPLLAHPITAARIAAFHAAMSFVAAPCIAEPPGMLLAGSTPRQQCGSFLAFLTLLLGIVLPTVLMAKVDLLAAVGCEQHRRGPSGTSPSRLAALEQALERSVRRLAGHSWVSPPPSTQGHSESSGSSGSEEEALAAAGSRPGQLPRAVLWWLLLCYCWLLSAALA
jgi:hypothetical protein